jgi:hypothetical protein
MGEKNCIFFAVMAELKRGKKEPVALFLNKNEAESFEDALAGQSNVRRVRVTWEEVDENREKMIQEIKDATDRLILKCIREAGPKGISFEELAKPLLSGITELEVLNSVRRLEECGTIYQAEPCEDNGYDRTYVHKDMK